MTIDRHNRNYTHKFVTTSITLNKKLNENLAEWINGAYD